MIVLYREIMMLWLRAGYGETRAGAPNSAKFRGGGRLQGQPKFDKGWGGGGGGSNNYLFFKR